MVQAQTYPKDRMEWIVLDDGQEEVGDLFDEADLPYLRFMRSDEKMTLGEKRNLLNQEARGEILVAMDDDDYYFPERISAAVDALEKNPTIDLAGSSEVYMFFSDTKEIYKFGPYFPTHATNGTMAWRKRYARTHRYDETVVFAEETSFLDGYKNPLVQLDPRSVMLVMSHSENTFDKTKIRNDKNPMIKKTTYRLEDFIVDDTLREFFGSL
jgi:glycosyltransferase involved in cell wall biosynthesis